MKAPLGEFVRDTLAVLDAAQVPHFVYGGVAAAVWGMPRETQDVDIVLCLADDRLVQVLAAFRKARYRIQEDADRTFAIDGWTRIWRRGRWADLHRAVDALDNSAFARRRSVRLFDCDVPLAAPEDLVLYKLMAYRPRDLDDVERILIRQRPTLDLAYLRRWADEIARNPDDCLVPSRLHMMLERLYR
ncbi:MAG: hypothetical protein HYZ53_09590 [Planctomycetes bacterium]|nr:hypothetical protein [Planctomycetota bacterium]